MKICIWYNPDQQEYQAGPRELYNQLRAESSQSLSYSILYKMSTVAGKMADRITEQLNNAQYELQSI